MGIGFNILNLVHFNVGFDLGVANIGSIGLGSSGSPDVAGMLQSILFGIM